MKCSICIATYNKASWLNATLKSIVSQQPDFSWEIVVVDDGSTDSTKEVCRSFPKVDYVRIETDLSYRNPAVARNVAYRKATGDVLICQSDEVVHASDDTIERLVISLEPGTFSIATVWNTDKELQVKSLEGHPKIKQLTGPQLKRPFFFLGALLRSDLYAAGGNDELYSDPGREDQAFGDSLMHGLNLSPRYVDIRGYHVEHPRPTNLRQLCSRSNFRYRNRQRECSAGRESWLSPGAPWKLDR